MTQHRLRSRTTLVTLLGGLAIGAGSAPALAQPHALLPGLWEMQVRNPELDAAREQMMKQLADAPPAMRRQIEQLMASQGVTLGGNGVRACITPEQARMGPNVADDEDGCTQEMDWKGPVGHYRMTCPDGRRGTGEITFTSDKAWEGRGEFVDPGAGGKVMKVSYSSRWLGSDCGAVKPVGGAR